MLAAPAAARDPGRWTLTGWSSLPNLYWQGVASAGPGEPLFFSGITEGLHRTDDWLGGSASTLSAIPDSVKAAEGYNHVGDIGYDRVEGGRVLLPLECYRPGGPGDPNTCGTGSIGVADPGTLAFRYYVKLDPAEIAKAMWVEPSPDGQLVWTSSGADLLAYSAADVSAANAAPGAPPIRSVRRLAGAVPPSGVTGATFRGGRLFLAGAQGSTYQVWSVNTATGARRLELELPNVRGEAEGLVNIRLLGAGLHFLVAPLGEDPSFGPTVGMLHFAAGRRAGRALRVRLRVTRRYTVRPRIAVRVTRQGRPVAGAAVWIAGARTETNARGRAVVWPAVGVHGRFAALAHTGRLRGRSAFVELGPVP